MSIERVELNKELILTVTSGRSGTRYLAKLLEGVPGVSAHHEPSPNYALVLRLVQSQPQAAFNYLIQHKLPAIQQCPTPVYAETSHMTCKGFLEPMILMGLRPALVILRRPPREVAWSFMMRQCVPARSTYGIRDLLDPRDLNVIPFPNWEITSNYQLCFWYALEMERRQLFYTDMAQKIGLPVVDITNTELNDWDKFSNLLRTFDLPITDDVQKHHAQISATHHNQNSEYLQIDPNVEEEERHVWSAVSYFQPILWDLINLRYKLPQP